jgi:23S rRNA A2030 N6-methylase RlmJ
MQDVQIDAISKEDFSILLRKRNQLMLDSFDNYNELTQLNHQIDIQRLLTNPHYYEIVRELHDKITIVELKPDDDELLQKILNHELFKITSA